MTERTFNPDAAPTDRPTWLKEGIEHATGHHQDVEWPADRLLEWFKMYEGSLAVRTDSGFMHFNFAERFRQALADIVSQFVGFHLRCIVCREGAAHHEYTRAITEGWRDITPFRANDCTFLGICPMCCHSAILSEAAEAVSHSEMNHPSAGGGG